MGPDETGDGDTLGLEVAGEVDGAVVEGATVFGVDVTGDAVVAAALSAQHRIVAVPSLEAVHTLLLDVISRLGMV